MKLDQPPLGIERDQAHVGHRQRRIDLRHAVFIADRNHLPRATAIPEQQAGRPASSEAMLGGGALAVSRGERR